MHRSPVYPVLICGFTFCWLVVLWFAFATDERPGVQAATLRLVETVAQSDQPAAPNANTEFKVTVGTIPDVCAPTKTITVSMGATIYYCYFLENKSKYTLTTHALVDPAIGLNDRRNLLFTPSSGMSPAYEIFGVVPAFQPIQSAVTWIATSTNGLTFTAQSQYRVNMPTLALTATLSADAQTCGANAQLDVAARTQVYYCYQVRNTSAQTLTIPKVAGGGANLSPQPPFVLTPGAGINLTATATITQTTDQAISMTGLTPNGLTTLAQAKTSARVPALQLVTTVGLVEECASTNSITLTVGAKVYYCYKLTNTGGVSLTYHRILGSTTPKGSRDLTTTVAVTADIYYPTPLAITETRAHTVTWIAWNAEGLTATASAVVTTTALTTLTVEVFYDVNGAKNREANEPALPQAHLVLSHLNGIPLTKTANISGLIVLPNIPARVYTATVTNLPRNASLPFSPSTGEATRPLDLRNRLNTHALFGFTLPPPVDDDNDGIPNQFEGAGDEDQDGDPNYLDYSPKIFMAVLRRAR